MINIRPGCWYFYANCQRCHTGVPLMEDTSRGTAAYRIAARVTATCSHCGGINTFEPADVRTGPPPPLAPTAWPTRQAAISVWLPCKFCGLRHGGTLAWFRNNVAFECMACGQVSTFAQQEAFPRPARRQRAHA